MPVYSAENIHQKNVLLLVYLVNIRWTKRFLSSAFMNLNVVNTMRMETKIPKLLQYKVISPRPIRDECAWYGGPQRQHDFLFKVQNISFLAALFFVLTFETVFRFRQMFGFFVTQNLFSSVFFYQGKFFFGSEIYFRAKFFYKENFFFGSEIHFRAKFFFRQINFFL